MTAEAPLPVPPHEGGSAGKPWIRRWAWQLAALVAILGAVYGVLTGLNSKNLKPTPARDLWLPDLEGKTVKLSDFKGKVVLVDFWATWCGPCVYETPHLKEIYLKHKDEGFMILGVSVDREGAEAVRPFARKYGVPYPLLVGGTEPQVGYPVTALPTAWLIDRKGRKVRKYVGFKPPEELEKDILAYLQKDK